MRGIPPSPPVRVGREPIELGYGCGPGSMGVSASSDVDCSPDPDPSVGFDCVDVTFEARGRWESLSIAGGPGG